MKNKLAKIFLGILVVVSALWATNAHAETNAVTAILNATVNPGGNPTVAWFEYGTEANLLNRNETTHRYLGAQNYSQNFSENITGLVPGMRYYFRVVTDNGYNVYRAETLTFVTVGTNYRELNYYENTNYNPVNYQTNYQKVTYQPASVFSSSNNYAINTKTSDRNLSAAVGSIGTSFFPNSALGWCILFILLLATIYVARRLAKI